MASQIRPASDQRRGTCGEGSVTGSATVLVAELGDKVGGTLRAGNWTRNRKIQIW
jgi:hypothetical protein